MSKRSVLSMLRLGATAVTSAGLLAASMVAASGTALAAGPAAGTKAKPDTIALSEASPVDSQSLLKSELTSARKADCAGKPVTGSQTLAQAIAQARKIEGKAGKAAVAAVDAGRDRTLGDAELDATSAQLSGNPVGALAALMAAYARKPADRSLLTDLGAVLGQLGEPKAALALFSQADRVKGPVQHPMGISDQASELNDRGFALIELRQWAAASAALSRAVTQAPDLSEAKLNLAMALTCQDKVPQAARMLAAGTLRVDATKFDEIGGAEIIPADQIMDVSQGHAGVWPTFTYPETIGNIVQDGSTFAKFNQDAVNAILAESKEAGRYGAVRFKLPQISQLRIADLELDAVDDIAGGWAADASRVQAAQAATTDLWGTVMTFGGTADQEEIKIIKAGGNTCSVEKVKMDQWLTSQTEAFHKDVVDWNDALSDEWAARSKWASGVLANIQNPDMNKFESYSLDTDKQSDISVITDMTSLWEEGADGHIIDDSSCPDDPGPDQNPPDDPRLSIAACSPAMKKASFSISFGVVKISVNCEKISVSVQEPILGPFTKVSWTRTGDVTAVVGVKGGDSLGPASAGIEAGVYVTVHGGQIIDAGITATEEATVKAGPITLQAGATGGTMSFDDIVSAMKGLAQ
jgi:Flp pilus assembly protein TadD